jgi:predicted extracellular nuclease
VKTRLASVGALACALAFMVGGAGGVPSANLVISQVYGAGGNSGAPLTHDFVELFNRGSGAVSLAGMSIQYASATGTGNLGASATQLTELPSVTLQPGQYFLVQQSGGANGVALPTPDHVDPTPIAMAAGAGKVALATGTGSLGCNGSSGQPCSSEALARIVDLVGYGNANFFEGASAASTLSSTTAALRGGGGCIDTDQNGADFAAGAPAPRNTTATVAPCAGDTAPFVAASTPTGGASSVALVADVTVTFSEPVTVTDPWFSILCAVSGAHTAVASGGPTTFTLDPDTNFAQGERCTVTVEADAVTDQDANDPPDAMAADHSFSFTTVPLSATIAEVQAAAHLSPLVGRAVTGLEGIVTARRTAGGRGVWVQDPVGDADPSTSEGVFVFVNAAPTAAIGDRVRVTGIVTEFRGGCADPCTPAAGSGFNNLTITQITSSNANVQILASGIPLPPATIIGLNGLIPPKETIDDDATTTRDVEVTNDFDPSDDAIDFYESLEGMLVQVDAGSAVVGPTKSFGEITVLPNGGAWATGLRTSRGGILYSTYEDGNPERIQVDDEILRDLAPAPRPSKAMPDMDVGAVVTSPIVGPLDYTFANYKIQATTTPTFTPSPIQRETARAPRDQELAVATFNVENLSMNDPQSKFDELAGMIVTNLRAPDLIGIEEVQDDSGFTDNGVTSGAQTWARLIAAIQAAGGPLYEFRQIDPLNNQDGGAPGGNIRVGFLFRTDRGLSFVDRPGGDATTPTAVVDHPSGPMLSLSPGRIDPANPAYAETRKSLAGEFRFRGKKLFAVVVHFSSKGDDQPLFGRFQPPTRLSEVARHGQAEVVADFVSELRDADPNAYVVVLGDINDFQFSETVDILGEGGLTTFVNSLPANERYSYVFEGNSQVLDQILATDVVLDRLVEYDVVHVNAEFAVQASDHEPSVARINMIGRP